MRNRVDKTGGFLIAWVTHTDMMYVCSHLLQSRRADMGLIDVNGRMAK